MPHEYYLDTDMLPCCHRTTGGDGVMCDCTQIDPGLLRRRTHPSEPGHQHQNIRAGGGPQTVSATRKRFRSVPRPRRRALRMDAQETSAWRPSRRHNQNARASGSVMRDVRAKAGGRPRIAFARSVPSIRRSTGLATTNSGGCSQRLPRQRRVVTRRVREAARISRGQHASSQRLGHTQCASRGWTAGVCAVRCALRRPAGGITAGSHPLTCIPSRPHLPAMCARAPGPRTALAGVGARPA